MDIIHYQASDFLNNVIKKNDNAKFFITRINDALMHYKKLIQKILFLEKVFVLTKLSYDRHLLHCSEFKSGTCRFSKYYESVLFFLQNEIEFYEKGLSSKSFKKEERIVISKNILDMIQCLSALELRNEAEYTLLKTELLDMKHYYYLDKKSWRQLFLGKISELVSVKILTEVKARQLVKKIDKAYKFKFKETLNMI